MARKKEKREPVLTEKNIVGLKCFLKFDVLLNNFMASVATSYGRQSHAEH